MTSVQVKTGHHNDNGRASHMDEDEDRICGQGFSCFCQQTSLHGWQYLDTEPGCFRKTIWVFVILGVCIASVYFTVLNITEFLKATTVTSINSTTASLSDIVFPSVILCNVNQVTASFLANLGVEEDDQSAKLLFDTFINGLKTNENGTEALSTAQNATLVKLIEKMSSSYQWNSTIPFIRLASQNCSDMLVHISWRSTSSYNFYNAFQSQTDYGACCLITPFLDFENPSTWNISADLYTGKDYHSIPKGTRNGIKNGLEVMIDVEAFDYAYFPRGAKGFRVVMTDARDKAVVNQDGFYVSAGTETLSAMTPTVLNTTPVAMYRFVPDQRDCYSDDEYYFKYMPWDSGFRYSMTNCLYESVLENIIENCHCLPNFANFRLNLTLGVCRGYELNCAQRWMYNFGNQPDPDLTWAVDNYGQMKKCRQRCEMQSETMMSTMSTYPNRQTFPFRQDYCFIMQKIRRICFFPKRKQFLEKRYNIRCSDIDNLYNGPSQMCNGKNYPELEDVATNSDISDFLFQYAADNIAVLKIFVKDPYYTNIKKDEHTSYISFIGNAGGLVGLCMGLSFISIFEIIYHCCNYCFKSVSNNLVGAQY